MVNYKIEELNTEFKDLQDSFSMLLAPQIEERLLFEWINKTIAFMQKVKIDPMILNSFISFFCPRQVKVAEYNSYFHEGDYVTKIGPFIYRGRVLIYNEWDSKKYSFPPEIGFYNSVIKESIKNIVEKENFVPTTLINYLNSTKNFSCFGQILENIENYCQKEDSIAIIKECKTLIETILNLDPELRKIKDLKKKLDFIIKTNEIRNNFGVSKDILNSIQNMRVIRNTIDHKDSNLKYNIPLITAFGYVYLTVFFFENVLTYSPYFEKNNENTL